MIPIASNFLPPFVDIKSTKIYLCIFLRIWRLRWFAYMPAFELRACVFSQKHSLLGYVCVVSSSWKIFYFHSPHLAHAYYSPACITLKLGLLPHRGIRAKLVQTDSAGGISASVWGWKFNENLPMMTSSTQTYPSNRCVL